jgi:deazaflavin-dependent oxidoreductase (nitroreductase family)
VNQHAPSSAPSFSSARWRFGNVLASTLARLGIGPMHILTTRGRRTGRPTSVPVVPVDEGGRRWLVAPYGDVGWVRNVRVTPEVELRRGRTTRSYATREVSAAEAGPVLKRYVAIASRSRAWFAADPDDPAEDFSAEADRHPVFVLLEPGR